MRKRPAASTGQSKRKPKVARRSLPLRTSADVKKQLASNSMSAGVKIQVAAGYVALSVTEDTLAVVGVFGSGGFEIKLVDGTLIAILDDGCVCLARGKDGVIGAQAHVVRGRFRTAREKPLRQQWTDGSR